MDGAALGKLSVFFQVVKIQGLFCQMFLLSDIKVIGR